ncbi:hypothetical protein HPB51_001263 [Rhipicephalus microplus]|uniref:Prolyl 4-hydroxylase alpha subunit domain-containing protein n=1 Tax=Rhipicephalus microplus TaxID=6941 RepID=A0A9J6E5J7_RHIMP|nr:hypothetical protein HPB51_001263 [Rhipicephalus microplus]
MVSKSPNLTSFLNDYYETTASKDRQLTHSTAEQEHESRTASPIDAYNTIKRLSVDWSEIVHQFREPDWIEIERLMLEANDTFPRQSDLLDAGEALIRIQKTYRLNLTDMARGVIMGHKATAQLTARDCLYFGQLLYSKSDFEHATKWFEEALTRLSLEKHPSITPRTVHAYLASSLEQALDTRAPPLPLSGASAPFLVCFARASSSRWMALRCAVESLERIHAPTSSGTRPEEKDLRCYLSVPHPYFRIGPVKMEVMSQDPYIVQFYDVIWPKEIHAIRNIGDPVLARATVRETTQNTVSHGRISQVGWVSPDSDPLLVRVNQRVSMLTGLSTDYERGDSEILQYNSYGPGGHYEPHHDYLFEGLTKEQGVHVLPSHLGVIFLVETASSPSGQGQGRRAGATLGRYSRRMSSPNTKTPFLGRWGPRMLRKLESFVT